MEVKKILSDILLSLNDAKQTRLGKRYDSPYASLVTKLKTEKEKKLYRRLGFSARYCYGDEISDVDSSYFALTRNIMPSDRMFYECFYFHLVDRLLSDKELFNGIDSEIINDKVLPMISLIIERSGISDRSMLGFPNDCQFTAAIKEFVSAALIGISEKTHFDMVGLKDVKIQWLYEYMPEDKSVTLYKSDGRTMLFKDGVLYNSTKST